MLFVHFCIDNRKLSDYLCKVNNAKYRRNIGVCPHSSLLPLLHDHADDADLVADDVADGVAGRSEALGKRKSRSPAGTLHGSGRPGPFPLSCRAPPSLFIPIPLSRVIPSPPPLSFRAQRGICRRQYRRAIVTAATAKRSLAALGMTTWGLALGMAETAWCGITTWGIRDDSGRRKLILKGNSNFPGQRPGLPPLLGARQRDQHRLHPLRGAIKG